MLRLSGYTVRVYQNDYLADWKIKTVELTWRERLLGWPWRPWRSTKEVRYLSPDPNIYSLPDGSWVCHPETYRALKERIERMPKDEKFTVDTQPYPGYAHPNARRITPQDHSPQLDD